MRIVVTGATGNVGTSVLDALSADPAVDSIVGMARRVPHEPGRWKGRVRWVAADVVTSDLRPLFAGADAVVHLAWLVQPSHKPGVLRATNVEGSRRVFRAVVDAAVPCLAYASSVAAYSPGPKDAAVDERWPIDGIPTSLHGRHKAEVERGLDRLEAEHPRIRVVRLRPAFVLNREAAAAVERLFLGRLVPVRLLRPLPVVPKAERLVLQAVHATDVAEAFRLAVTRDVRGAYNIAADPLLDGDALGRVMGGRPVPVPPAVLRIAADLTWRLRLQPTPVGWVDVVLGAPVLNTGRAKRVLGWSPQWSAGEALLDLLEGMAEKADGPTPALARAPAPPKARERRKAAAAAAPAS